MEKNYEKKTMQKNYRKIFEKQKFDKLSSA